MLETDAAVNQYFVHILSQELTADFLEKAEGEKKVCCQTGKNKEEETKQKCRFGTSSNKITGGRGGASTSLRSTNPRPKISCGGEASTSLRSTNPRP